MIETLNRDCFCVSMDPDALRRAIEERCPNVFAALPVFVSRLPVDQMADVIRAVEEVVAFPAYREAVLDDRRGSRVSAAAAASILPGPVHLSRT